MILRLLACLGVAAHCLPAAAVDDVKSADRPAQLGDPQRWGRLSRVVIPTYPKEALERRENAIVHVDGVVHGSGMLINIAYRSDSAAYFVAALQKVVPYWLFDPAIGDDCQPTAEVVSTRVSFEIGDEPTISVTHATKARPAESLPPHFRVLHQTVPSYPVEMLKRNWDARVFARMEIDPAGNVTDVKSRAFSRYTRDPSHLREFQRPAERALMTWRYGLAPEGMTRPRVGCLEVKFNIKG